MWKESSSLNREDKDKRNTARRAKRAYLREHPEEIPLNSSYAKANIKKYNDTYRYRKMITPAVKRDFAAGVSVSVIMEKWRIEYKHAIAMRDSDA